MIGEQSDSNNIVPKNKSDFSAGLYIVATPIGNLRDITLRALDVLKASDAVICEDTRISHRLLAEYGINKTLIVYNDHNAEKARPAILRLLKEGKILSLISDAGTPLISDPGYKLSAAARAEGFYVTAMPGACSAITALTLSSQATDSFFFDGFLPAKAQAQKNRLAELKNIRATLIFFERAERIPETVANILEVLGNRKITIARELTKKFEEVLEDSATNLLKNIEEKNNLLGEAVLLVGAAEKQEVDIASLDSEISELMRQNVPAKLVSELLADKYDVPKKQIYARANELKK